jgi:outer membrane protein insertion porin family
MKILKRLISFILLANITTVLAFEEFIVNDIRIAGLQRVSTGSIFNTIPISVGDKIDDRKIVDITRALFATEYEFSAFGLRTIRYTPCFK